VKNLVIIVVFLTSIMSVAQNDTQVFEKANALYNQEKYQEAIDAYTTILNNGKESPELYYNLGSILCGAFCCVVYSVLYS